MKLNELRIYTEANHVSDKVWDEVNKFSFFEKDTLGKQLVRSADSIAANIAEGYGRYSYKENRLFCFYSRGSLLETIHWLEKCRKRNVIDKETASSLIDRLNKLYISLNAYIKTIGKTTTDN